VRIPLSSGRSERATLNRRAAVGLGQWAVIGAAASPLGVEILPIDLAVTGNNESAFTEFARGPNDGLIVGVGTAATIQRKIVVGLAARHMLPAVYPYRFFVEGGGLMSYGPNLIDHFFLLSTGSP
jgi:putative ABC transport system substrate-binding protein